MTKCKKYLFLKFLIKCLYKLINFKVLCYSYLKGVYILIALELWIMQPSQQQKQIMILNLQKMIHRC